MKVLHIINSLKTGGAEKLIVETFPKISEFGIALDLLLLDGTETDLLRELKSKNCCEIFFTKSKSAYSIRNILSIMKFMKNYDLVHVHLFPTNYYTVLAKIISFSKVPIVFTEHNTSNRRFRNNWSKPINIFFYKRFDNIICISEEVMKVVKLKTKINDSKLQLIHNGINLINFSDAKPLNRKAIDKNLSSTDFLLLQVSSFRKQKDHSTLIRSLLHLPREVKLLLAGDGVLKDFAQNLVYELNLADRVFFLGNRSDIPQLLKTVDVAVLSSVYEGFPLVSLESMASGKPFVASNVPGLSEIVADYGILFEKGNSRQLADYILKLINDDLFYTEKVEKGFQRVAEFDINLMVRKTVNLYKDVSRI